MLRWIYRGATLALPVLLIASSTSAAHASGSSGPDATISFSGDCKPYFAEPLGDGVADSLTANLTGSDDYPVDVLLEKGSYLDAVYNPRYIEDVADGITLSNTPIPISIQLGSDWAPGVYHLAVIDHQPVAQWSDDRGSHGGAYEQLPSWDISVRAETLFLPDTQTTSTAYPYQDGYQDSVAWSESAATDSDEGCPGGVVDTSVTLSQGTKRSVADRSNDDTGVRQQGSFNLSGFKPGKAMLKYEAHLRGTTQEVSRIDTVMLYSSGLKQAHLRQSNVFAGNKILAVRGRVVLNVSTYLKVQVADPVGITITVKHAGRKVWHKTESVRLGRSGGGTAAVVWSHKLLAPGLYEVTATVTGPDDSREVLHLPLQTVSSLGGVTR